MPGDVIYRIINFVYLFYTIGAFIYRSEMNVQKTFRIDFTLAMLLSFVVATGNFQTKTSRIKSFFISIAP